MTMDGRQRVSEAVLTGLLGLLTLVLFAPVSLWLVRQTMFHEQLTHALMILGLAAVLLFLEHRTALAFHGKWNGLATSALGGSFFLLALSSWLRQPWFLLPAHGLAAAGWGLFAFGPAVRRAVFSLAAAFCGYALLAGMIGAFDWPMRALAGRYSQWLLEAMGFSAGLAVAPGNVPRLLLVVDGFPFEVAAECNGFGLLGASVLLGVMLVVYRSVAWVDRMIVLAASVLLAVLFNVLRIIVICILAPVMPDHYQLMHEIVGNVFFWAGLAAVYGVVRLLDRSVPESPGG
jgi:exosortase/archaeosortase family protein